MLLSVTTYRLQLEIIRILAIESRDTRQHIVPMLITGCARRMRITSRVNTEWLWWLCKNFGRINLNTFRMRYCNQLNSVDEERLLELIRDAQLVISIALA